MQVEGSPERSTSVKGATNSASPDTAASPAGGRSTSRTRTSAAWTAITSCIAALVVVLVFALQNLKSVEVSFLSAHGRLPLGILLVLVAGIGALVVYAFGAARIVQLRLAAHRSKRVP